MSTHRLPAPTWLCPDVERLKAVMLQECERIWRDDPDADIEVVSGPVQPVRDHESQVPVRPWVKTR